MWKTPLEFERLRKITPPPPKGASPAQAKLTGHAYDNMVRTKPRTRDEASL